MSTAQHLRSLALRLRTNSMPLADLIPSLQRAADELLAAVKRVKSNLLHRRRFGVDTLADWRNAAFQAEGDIEEAINKAQDQKL